MSRILILGGDGMLGHQLLRQWRDRHAVAVTLRQNLACYPGSLFKAGRDYANLDARRIEDFLPVLADFRPEVVVNCVGIVKQRAEASDPIPSLELNALFPHKLAGLAAAQGFRLIHLSTDCVFSGERGHYSEVDRPDPVDLYGHSKLLGEVASPGCLTLRTSMIGPELTRRLSLYEWFRAQRGPVKGYRQAVFSGLTTLEMARVLERLIVEFPLARGLYHLAGTAIDKCALLELMQSRLHLPVEIVPDDGVRIDRSLDASRFNAEFGYAPPTWTTMVDELTLAE